MLRLIAAIAARLSPGAVSRLGRWVGRFLWSVLRLRRAVALDNLQRALGCGPQEARSLGRQVYQHLGFVAVEFLRVSTLTPQRARDVLGEENVARMHRLLAAGRGVLILGAHLGNWDLLACAAGRCGLPVNVVTRSIKRSGLNRFWMEQRRRCGVNLLAARGSAMAIRRALRRGEIVAMVLDQHEPGGVVVPFFDRPAATAGALARLARASGAPVVPAFLIRDAAQQRYRLAMQEPLALVQTADPRADLNKNTALFTRVIERAVRAHPEQWFWVHRRWKV